MNKIHNHILKFQILCICFLGISVNLFAQTEDFQLRITERISTDIFKKSEFSLDLQQRMTGNASQFGLFYIEPSISHEFNKFLKGDVGYRLGYQEDNSGSFEIRHRISTSLKVQKKLSQFKLSYRQKLQLTSDHSNFFDLIDSRLVSRNQFRCVYTIRSWALKPTISYENFISYSNDQSKFLNNRNRYIVGTSFDLNQRNQFDLYYMVDIEVNESYPDDVYTLGISYHYTF